MAAPTLLLQLAVLLLASVTTNVGAWRQGRATFYGNEPWYWSIHHGSCGFGYQWPDQNTGWDIDALSDQHPEYRGSCGGCYEIKCQSSDIKDGFGQNLNRHGTCRDGSASVIVRTTDTCPCQYQNNYYSNKRWCCGDIGHFDMSVWSFQKLTDMKWGVIPIQYRRVDCGQQPDNKAYLDYSQMFPGEFPPKSMAGNRGGDFDWHKYFPNGGYLNSKSGDGSGLVSVDEFLSMAGRGGSSGGSSQAQYGRK